ncbi:hypothetical protein WA1_19010 [Scytonema hofmannii PCC 7110]|jgi:uncharacterized protein (DUF433 family)|uniref:Putative antitoxin VapB45-like DNA-binding HTH domain-containing protein n=1 Tax=Scytonema hofmannii PCC 7110 TaxID=128403 RepID=A0A139XBM5_9CYAN|nr:DUF433 domain-containing protein [Scytonema hofmannii]KYC42091.1 hypothetical protein WA1_19010 [Scytonema hofmannii PCC 7110]
MTDLYGGIDPRNIPSYSISDAAHYLRIPRGTIRSWTVGRRYPIVSGSNFFKPLIPIRNGRPRLLSFTNLIEVHVLRAIRKQHKIDLYKVRSALDFIEEQFQVSHPLAREIFRTDGVDLFIERYGSLINASKSGQEEMRDALNAHLERIEPDDTGLAIKLYPFTRSHEEDNPRIVVIDPRIAFGRLVIAGTGIATDVLTERYEAGDSIDELAYDYQIDRLAIEEAIRYELLAA